MRKTTVMGDVIAGLFIILLAAEVWILMAGLGAWQ